VWCVAVLDTRECSICVMCGCAGHKRMFHYELGVGLVCCWFTSGLFNDAATISDIVVSNAKWLVND
jgi:hypothetical protein